MICGPDLPIQTPPGHDQQDSTVTELLVNDPQGESSDSEGISYIFGEFCVMIVTFSMYIHVDSYVCDDVEVCEDDTDFENSSDTEDEVSAPNFPESEDSHSEANTLVYGF